jgi:hypothetical protein
MSDPSRSNEPQPISDAHSLYDTDEIRPIRVPATPIPEATSSAHEGYDLEGGPIVDDDELPAPVPIPIPTRPVDRPKSSPRPKPKLEFERADPEGTSEFEGEVSEIDPIWSRWAEWGPDLKKLGAVGLGTLFLAWYFSGSISNVFLILLLGGSAMIVLSYPILITLERPVRVTPEHAVVDFFAAASHHFPHYRRMWLLVSVLGRESSRLSTFDAFRDHWKQQIDRWKQVKGVSKFTPLKFQIEGFRADKSTGKETSKADYSVIIYVRDREAEGPIDTFRMVHGLVKGPDKMWYMNRGTLGHRSN